MKTNLIKIDGYWVLVSDEVPYLEKDWSLDETGNVINLWFYPEKLKGKIIASENPAHNLPSIIFSDKIAKELGIVDVDNLAYNFYKQHEPEVYAKYFKLRNHQSSKREKYRGDKDYLIKAFTKGYNKCLEDNKEKLFKLSDFDNFKEEYNKFVNSGGLIGSSEEWIQHQNLIPWFKNYIQSLSKQEYKVLVKIEKNSIFVEKIL